MGVIAILCLLLFMTQNIKASDKLQSLQADMQYKKGYHPFMLFGNQPIPDKGVHRSKLTSSCSTCIDTAAAEAIYVKLKVGSALRYNLIKVLGFILNRSSVTLNTAYYTSLYFIWTCIKLNHVDILSLVQVVDQIMFVPPNKQFEILFEAMEKHLPPYLVCAATFWKEGIQKKIIHLDEILMPFGGNTLEVNVLDTISPEEAKKSATDDAIEGPAVSVEDKRIVSNFNINILHLMRFIKKQNKFTPYQWVTAGLLQFFPRTLLQPELEESIQIMVQYLHETQLPDLTKAQVPSGDREPYKMIEYLFEIILQSKPANEIIKESAKLIIRNLKSRSPTAVNPNFVSFTYFVQPEAIKINDMLKYIVDGTYPVEVRLAAKRLEYYLDNKIIDYFTFMMNFNPYLYSTPTEVLMAILDRILRRLPELPSEVLGSVGAIYSHLIFRYRYVDIPVTFPSDMADIDVMLLGLLAPDIDKPMRQNVEAITSHLRGKKVEYTKMLVEKIPVFKCSTPVICLIELLNLIIDMKLDPLPSEVKDAIMVIISSDCETGDCPIDATPDTDIIPAVYMADVIRKYFNLNITTDEAPEETTQSTGKPTTQTTEPPPSTSSEGPPSTLPTSPSTTPTTPTAPPPTKSITTIDPTLTEPATEVIDHIVNMLMNQTQSSDSGDEVKNNIKTLLDLLKSDEYKNVLNQTEDNFALVITSYLTFLEMVESKHVGTEHFQQWLKKYIKKQEQISKLATVIEETKFDKPVTAKLLIALPRPKNDKEKEMFETLTTVLLRQDLYDEVYRNIDKSKEINSGIYLEALLNEEVKLTTRLTAKELEAVNYYLTRVQKHGFGEVKITYGVSTQILSEQVDISLCMDNALHFKSLNTVDQVNFNNLIDYMQKNSQVLSTWEEWTFHTASGDFSKALFKHILKTSGLEETIRKAIESLKPQISFSGDGKIPCIKTK